MHGFRVHGIQDYNKAFLFYQVDKARLGVAFRFVGEGANGDANPFAGFYFLEVGVEVADDQLPDRPLGAYKPEHDQIRPLGGAHFRQNIRPLV